MGRPSKQKQVVDKYFKKHLHKRGKLDCHECIYCCQTFAYNSWRMAKHLLTCTKTSIEFKTTDMPIIQKLFKNQNGATSNDNTIIYDEYNTDNDGLSNEKTNHQEMDIQDIPSCSQTSTCSVTTSETSSCISLKSGNVLKNTKIENFVDRFINQKEETEIWELLAKACYATGTPLSFTENIYFQRAFKKIRPCLRLPSQYQLSNNLLNAEYKRIEKVVKEKIISSNYISVQLDGWTNIRSEPIVNIVLTTPEPVVYEIIETGTNKHSGAYMASIIERIVCEIGPKKVISVVSDNAKNMVKAWDIFIKNNPSSQISFFGCAGHVLNLLCKDIVNLPTFREIQNSTKSIIKQFKYSHILNGLLKEIQSAGISTEDVQNSHNITLKLPVVTRWGSEAASLKSLIINKQYLKQVAISNKSKNLLNKESVTSILDNTTFWVQVETMYNLLKPVANWISILESETCNVSTVVVAFNDIQEVFAKQIQSSTLLKREEYSLLQKLNNRKHMAVRKIHLAGHLLDPIYKGKFLKNNESIDATEFISNLAEHLQISIPDIMSELAEYRTNSGLWSKTFVWDSLKARSDGNRLHPLTWWKGICTTAKISSIAVAILECSPTSASTERSFSTYGIVHTARRNRLTNDRASKLVYIKHNLKIEQGFKQNKNKIYLLNTTGEDSYDFPGAVKEEEEEDSIVYPSDNESNETDELFNAVNSYN